MQEPQPHRSSHSRRTRLWLVIAAIVIVVLVAQGILSRHFAHAELERDANEYSVQTVEIIAPTRMKPTQDLVLAGDIRAFSDAPIFARTNGYLRRWTAEVRGRGACHHPDGAARLVESALSVFGAELDLHRRQRCTAPPAGLPLGGVVVVARRPARDPRDRGARR